MKEVKVILLLLGSWTASRFTTAIIPIIILLFANAIDYITAIFAASNRDEKISSYKSFSGIKKKISMYLLIFVGLLLDITIHYICDQKLGFKLPMESIFTIVVAIWLILNEFISILENICDLGITIPFLKPVVEWLKKYIESKTTNKMEDTQ